MRRRNFGKIALATVAAPPCLTMATDDGESDDFSTCRAQMELIYEYLRAYERKIGRMPEYLSSALIGLGVEDHDILTCPASHRIGDFSITGGRINNPSKDEDLGSYLYEFTPEVSRMTGGRPLRDSKVAAMRILGADFGRSVPLLRCKNHLRAGDEAKENRDKRLLNISWDGRFYESGLYWEAFVQPVVSAKVLEYDLDELLPKLIPQRGDVPPACLDLGNYYTTPLPTSLLEQGKPVRLVSENFEFKGIPFDVRGLVQLAGKCIPRDHKGGLAPFPESSETIPVARRGKLHLLIGCALEARVGEVVAQIEVRLKGEEDLVILPLIFGENVARWIDPKKVEQREKLPQEVILLEKLALPKFGTAEAAPHRCRSWIYTWHNPTRAQVESITLRSTGTSAAPFLAAVTVLTE